MRFDDELYGIPFYARAGNTKVICLGYYVNEAVYEKVLEYSVYLSKNSGSIATLLVGGTPLLRDQ